MDVEPSESTSQADRGVPAEPAPRMPRWVKVFAAIAVVVVVLLAVMLLSGGNHGPGRHLGTVDVTADARAAYR